MYQSLLLLLATTQLTAAAGTPALARTVFGSGGGAATNGARTLNGALGQALTGRFTGSARVLCAGFWCGLLPLTLKQ